MSYEKIWVPTMVGEVDFVFLLCKAVWPHLVAGGGGVHNIRANSIAPGLGRGLVAHRDQYYR